MDFCERITMFMRIFISGYCILVITEFHRVNSSNTRGSLNYLDSPYENSTCTAHILQLSEENKMLHQKLESTIYETDTLRYQLKSLHDQCGNAPSYCSYNGEIHLDNDRWYPDSCTTCRCQNGIPNCQTSYHSSDCMLDCSDDMCLNGGTCQLGVSSHSIQCLCPEGFSGPLCEQTSCTPIRVESRCDENINSWYFDSYSNRCKVTEYGCYDPRSTFSSYESCSLFCLQGTCCYRMTFGDNEEMICQANTMENCQMLCQQQEVEVVGFYPGIQCPGDGCALLATKTCHSGTTLYSPKSTFSFGCDSCECLEEYMLCSCYDLSVRREIRDLSYAERIQYQKLISKLQLGNDQSVWRSLSKLYAAHFMHANSPLYFLIWNRNFLRTMERHLQELDCSASIPYLDFTLDAGNFHNSIIWSDDYFGRQERRGDDTPCKQYTIPQSDVPWTPCIKRNLSDSSLPSMVDVAMALAKSDFTQFSSDMQGIVNYIHSFIGGDMGTAGGPDDPIFYSIHAYIDMVFWKWQKRHGSSAVYSDEVLYAVLSPFNTVQRYLMDSERDMCVSYKSIGTDDHQHIEQKYNMHTYEYNSLDNDIMPQCSNNGCSDWDMRSIMDAGNHMQSILYNQEEPFLLSLPRSCSPTVDSTSQFVQNAWNDRTVLFQSKSINQVPSEGITDLCKQFCFTADIFLPTESSTKEASCNSKQVPVCDATALSKCPYYTYAPCRLSLCGNCSLICHVNNEDVDCNEPRSDYCLPNPCQNNGICRPSQWTSLPHLTSCDCLPGFEGEFCEENSKDRCFLPQDSGKSISDCGIPSKRWYFDLHTQACHSFQYHGCLGNSNNFLTFYECRVTCMIGACCWRTPLYTNSTYGFSKEGYDRYGFNVKGKSRKNEQRTYENGYGGAENIFRFSNYDYQGYDQKGYNKEGLDRFGYNNQGYHYRTKVNLTGFDAFGDHDGIIDFDEFGYDRDGYNRAGLNCFGYNKEGWDYYGLASGWSFECRALSLKDCRSIEQDFPKSHREVVSFSLGKKCEEVNCGQQCGCDFLDNSILVGTKFPLGCGTCECTLSHRINCSCTTTSLRKELRDLTFEEISRYQKAIKYLMTHSIWQNLTHLYQNYLPQSHGSPLFLPWHRFFLRYAEMKLQEIDCSVTIPYFDWTLDVGNLESSMAWQANMFGGNGNTKEDHCVIHYPFKDSYSTDRQACLRRNFNNSIHLPDAIDLEKISRMESFEEFSSQLQRISGLFHLFVGGHMATPESAYDPITLSFYAFIDKIWFEWFMNNPRNVEKFPQNFRYVTMVPFSVTPDDVLFSKTGLCVSYIELTEGAPCVSDKIHTEAVSHHSKQIYDIDGFDRDGYDVYGFDRLGWDRYGFNRDTYNRDGFDASGFSRLGYDRYGFDRSGCSVQGHCIHHQSSDIDKIDSSPNWDEFNEIGFRPSGVDFYGYDIYGFNVNGFDKLNCSYFFRGPFYPIHMKNIRIKLKELQTEELKKIQNICNAVSSLPSWWLQIFWFDPISDSSNEDSLMRLQVMEHLFSPFTNTKSIRLTPTPDERFCFPLQIHSQCELHNGPVACPFHKCGSTYCESQPSVRCRSFGCGSCDDRFLDLVSRSPAKCNNNAGCMLMNGTSRKDGETWVEEGCITCSCKESLVSCSPVNCDVHCDHPVIIPNECCPVCDGCMQNDLLLRNGDTFIDPQNPCLQCNCRNGSIRCSSVECGRAVKPCKRDPSQPGKKCSTCGPHTDGSYWMESPCHNCTCEDGNVLCNIIECPLIRCQYPARSAGECCRHCHDCEYSNSYIRHLEIFLPGNCQECQCREGNVSCRAIDCEHPKCLASSTIKDKCCQQCKKSCFYDGKNYNDGENFNPALNACINCSCDDGNVMCSGRETCSAQCTHGIVPEGLCCSPCTDCQYRNHIVPDQLLFSPPDDPCARCVCERGNITCMRETCPQLRCRDTELPAGACCPVCKGCANSNGQYMKHGQKWIHAEDTCQVCLCQEGMTKCERMECDIPCSHPVVHINSCCPECNDCEVLGRIYQNNKEIPSKDPCKKCFCYRGSMECESLRCPTLSCDAPKLEGGECCPTCKVCNFQGDIYEDGQKFQPKSDSCYYCTCNKGAVECERKHKCNPQCSHPEKLPNQCCPICDGCEFEGKLYKNREKFTTISKDSCRQCECSNGTIECIEPVCNRPKCPSPNLLRQECCEECSPVCSDGVKVYEEGDTWIPYDDNCKLCICKNSMMVCMPVDCPPPNCHHAAAPFGVCCRQCDHCEFTQRLYRNGQEFTHENDPCQICRCLDGNVSCETVLCDPLPCKHPTELENVCCPVCSSEDLHCEYLGKRYEAWENFMDPKNPCSECVCIDGMVSCHQVLCLNSECPNPQLGSCCESCDGCSYAETNYMNHVSFRDPLHGCRNCKCDDGIVSCQQQTCENAPCQSATLPEGQCCPTCQSNKGGCDFKGNMYADGEHFLDPGDPCVECYCEYPEVYCHVHDCDEYDCSDPVTAQCCQSCSDCFYLGMSYEAGPLFPNPENACQVCSCKDGMVSCSPNPCPQVPCSHPIHVDCCPVCNGCFFDGKIYKEMDEFPDPANPCHVQYCQNGNVLSRSVRCPPVTCEYPSKMGCCSECIDCFYENEIIENGHKVSVDGSDACQECVCIDGNIDCHMKLCPTVHCTDPAIEDCCPVCHLGCLYDGELYKFGAEFDHPKDPCSECACMDGSVFCGQKPCGPTLCKNPIRDPSQCCPSCPDHCVYRGKKYPNGSAFPSQSDNCKECTCLYGDVICETKICPEISCLHPGQGKCCLECENCEFFGKVYADGKNFTNPEELCETCLCTKGQVTCRRNSCVQCLHPIVNDYHCCPICDGCHYKGNNYTNQELFSDPGNACEECVCKNGSVACHKLSCSLPSCANPVLQPGICCPQCPGCDFSGLHIEENEEFRHPDNVCEKCICKESHVLCSPQVCHRKCTHPEPDPCCPLCEGCLLENQRYANGERFQPDPCQACECKDGNVLCVSEQCPELQCHLRTRIPGTCCETCRGCVYEGNEYENGQSWISSTNPCLSCSCYGGTVTCQNVICPSECAEPIPVSGLCCPVCPECQVKNKNYKSGDVFFPDPCESCTCDSGHVFCIRSECPTLIGCPEEAIKPPGDGECCPTCASFGTSCTRDQIGKLVYPSEDPCFSCQCSDNFMWICSKEFCSHLNCPPNEILISEKECCPKCKVCLSDEIHAHGDSWSPTNDVCTHCICNYGHVECKKIECPVSHCENNKVEFRPPGKCCSICTSTGDLSCDYGGHHYEHGQIWRPDPCTICQCTEGKMQCSTERCLPLQCPSDEIQSVDPGQCCPKCMPRPATCVAFGDPHYRTFDGAAISFQGTCRYVLTADCTTQMFNILVENNDRGFNGVSWTHRVVVVLQNASVDLRAGPTLYVKGRQIEQLPYFEDPILYVENTGSSVLVTTNVGVQVLWNGDGYVEVIVSGVYRQKTCGLCGNFNNFPEDDMRMPTNDIAPSEAEFGNSWKNPGTQPEGCTESVDLDPCSIGGYRIRKIANSKCSILKQSLFAACHRFIPPEPYFAACVYDVCACSENDDCLCDILSAYSKECSKAGVILHWRSEGLCGIKCSYEEGFVFDECGPPCPRTCENKNLPIGILAAQCFKPCVPGCQCSADKVLHNGKCIRLGSCP